MKCPYCGYTESKVVDSRPADEGATIRRRRECLACARRFTSYETVEKLPIIVVKKDGSRVPFDREKLLNSMLRAFEKRSVSMSQLDRSVDNIEQQLQNNLEREVLSRELGDMAMDELRILDEVAYIRFASVYRQFKDAASFLKEIQSLINEK